MLFKACEYFAKALDVLFKVGREDNNVIEVEKARDVVLFSYRYVIMRRWNVAGAFDNPNVIRLHSNKPMGVVKAVFGLSSSSISTCQ